MDFVCPGQNDGLYCPYHPVELRDTFQVVSNPKRSAIEDLTSEDVVPEEYILSTSLILDQIPSSVPGLDNISLDNNNVTPFQISVKDTLPGFV